MSRPKSSIILAQKQLVEREKFSSPPFEKMMEKMNLRKIVVVAVWIALN
jgi:hypothetical protein